MRFILSLCASLVLSACASNPPPACPDLSGTYSDQSSPPGTLLSALLLKGEGERSPPRTVTLTSLATGSIAVIADRRRLVLENGRDFVCAAGGVELIYTTSTTTAVPLVASTSETTHYTLRKASGGALVASRNVKTSGAVFGLALSGPLHEEQPLTWHLEKT